MKTETKRIVKIAVRMSGYCYLEVEATDEEIMQEDFIDEQLDNFDFAEASDINDSIDWKLRYADSIKMKVELDRGNEGTEYFEIYANDFDFNNVVDIRNEYLQHIRDNKLNEILTN